MCPEKGQPTKKELARHMNEHCEHREWRQCTECNYEHFKEVMELLQTLHNEVVFERMRDTLYVTRDMKLFATGFLNFNHSFVFI